VAACGDNLGEIMSDQKLYGVEGAGKATFSAIKTVKDHR
jgi:hypothetical protein